MFVEKIISNLYTEILQESYIILIYNDDYLNSHTTTKIMKNNPFRTHARTTFKNCPRMVLAAKFEPRFRADTLTLSLSL